MDNVVCFYLTLEKLEMEKIGRYVLVVALVVALCFTYVRSAEYVTAEDTLLGKPEIYATQFPEKMADIARSGICLAEVLQAIDKECRISIKIDPFIEAHTDTAESLAETVVPFVVVEERSKEEQNISDIQQAESAQESVVVLYGNGGVPETIEIPLDNDQMSVKDLPVPKRLGKVFDGWYADVKGTDPVTSLKRGRTELFAKWKEFRGFASDDEGMIVGYTDREYITLDGFLLLPTHESCVGVRMGAFTGVEDDIVEIYIPENITNLPEGVFHSFNQLMYIEVSASNPEFMSKEGILYRKSGELFCYPQGRNN